MLRINELKQAVIDGKAALNGHLEAETKAKTALSALLRSDSPAAEALVAARAASEAAGGKVSAAREALQLDEEALHAEEQRLALEDAKLAKNPSGRVVAGKNNKEDEPWHTEADGPEKQARHVGLGRFIQAAARASSGQGHDPRLYRATATGMGETVGADGGFAVPVEYAPGIEASMFQSGDLLSRVDARIITGNAINYTVMRETSRADGSRQGGILGYWVDEGTAPDATKFALAQIEMKLRKVAALGYATEELNQDAAAVGQHFELAFAEELTFQVENKIWRGSGAGCPQGFTVAPCLVSVSKETGQAAATINTTNLSKMWARLPARSKANAVWMGNVDIEPQLDELSIAAGTAALEPRFVNYGPDGILRIKGRPFIPVEYAETLGTVGDLALVDLSQYRLIRKAAGVEQAFSIHVLFAQGQITYRATYRADGQAVPRAAITPFKGSNTLSPFVVLATRS